jgi:ATP-dependent helicase/nuclease subunit B
MAVVAGLREQDIPVRDIAVVVRDLDQYEQPLFRAALQYGLVSDMWTQLRVTQTRPFALITSVCEVLNSEAVDKHTLLEPLEHRWSPPAPTDSQWPIAQETVQRTAVALPEETLTRSEWVELVQQNEQIDGRVSTYLQWLTDVPSPRPEAVADVLNDVVDAYAAHGLQETKATDSPALLNTERDARAVRRVETLVDQLETKLSDELNHVSVEQSWGAVAELATVIATQRPGSREHSHARAVDIFEANDIWGLDIPYVIIAGTTADKWPKQTSSTLQPEFEDQVIRGSGDASTLAPDTSWTPGHDLDHFADALRAASNGVIVTRHTEITDGEAVHPSPFLRSLNTDQLTDKQRQQLRSAEQALPASISDMLQIGDQDE